MNSVSYLTTLALTDYQPRPVRVRTGPYVCEPQYLLKSEWAVARSDPFDFHAIDRQ